MSANFKLQHTAAALRSFLVIAQLSRFSNLVDKQKNIHTNRGEKITFFFSGGNYQ